MKITFNTVDVLHAVTVQCIHVMSLLFEGTFIALMTECPDDAVAPLMVVGDTVRQLQAAGAVN